jgi:DNA replication protein DnaC
MKTPLPSPEDRLREFLTQLGLSQIREIYAEVISRATKEGTSFLETLSRLMEEEVRVRFDRRVARRIKDAKIAVAKTLDSFDFKHPRRIKRDQILALFDLDFIPKKNNVCFLGGTGVGKTHLATALALTACQKGYRVLFSTAVNIVNHLQAAQSDGTFLRRLKSYLSPDLLVIDELGYLPIDRHGADLLFQVISGRYECGSVILTTNRAFKDWASVFNDATVAAAVIDRLAHHSEVVIIEGRSYRIRDKDNEVTEGE